MASPNPTNFAGLAGGTDDFICAVDHCDPPPYPVVQSIELYIVCLDGRRFVALLLVGDATGIHDARTGRICDTNVGVWMKRYWHWS